MEKTILTTAQSKLLAFTCGIEYIAENFYFTGGTALAEFYLHHRLSEDLDFFSEDEINVFELDHFMDDLKQDFGLSVTKWSRTGFFIYTAGFPNGDKVKMDFVYQPFKRLELSQKKYKKVQIASIWDIAIDKLYTIFHRAKSRDFIDLYYILQKEDYSFDQLFAALEEKYNAQFDEMSLLSRLPIVKDIGDFPTMLVPFDKKKMEDFYYSLVRQLEKGIFK